MRRLLALFFAIQIAVSGCAPAMQQANQPDPNSPCNDPTYVALKARPVDQLTIREYERLRDLDKTCIDYLAVTELDRDRRERGRTMWYLLAGLFGAGLLILSLDPAFQTDG
jgi:hypothetical protein